MNRTTTRDLRLLNDDLTTLQKDGVTLSKREKRQLATDLKTDVKEPTPWWKKMLHGIEKAAPLVAEIVSAFIL